ncbi:single-strand DNA-binding protein [Leifsonia sp. EB41]|uniref:single-stranded DNA-binding protein n=1 Tax=Leifsonia sp. EB41 TaxID=3156260 RepID=UPI003515B039
MAETVTVRGTVATSPRHVEPETGAPITSFRLVTNDRRRGRRSGARVPEAQSNWFTVTAFDELAVSAAACIARGDPLVVAGRLCVRDWEGEQLGVTVEIEAEAIGHDLSWAAASSRAPRPVSPCRQRVREGLSPPLRAGRWLQVRESA